MRVLRGVVVGVLVGVVLGVLARALMHLVEIGMGTEPEWRLDAASIVVVGLFVVSSLGAALSRTFDLSGWQLAVVLLATSAPLLGLGTTFAIDQLGEILDHDLTPPWTAELIAMVAVIGGVALVTPYAAWRAGRGKLGG